MSVISKMTFDNGSTKNLISSTFYGKCSTAAATAAKTVTIGGWDESVKDNVSGATVHIYFEHGNSALNPTLNIDSQGAHKIITSLDTSVGSFSAGIYSFTLIPSNVPSDNTYRWMMEANVDWSNVSNKPSLDFIPTSQKGANSGVATLDANGKVPSSQLPSYVDDVLEYAARSLFPSTGTSGIIYIDTSTNLTYRWSGSNYVEISPSLALGTTHATAAYGDEGATAYAHATDSGRLTTAASSGLYKVSVTAQGHVGSATAVTKSDITALGIPGENTDTKVTQNATTTADNNYKVLLSNSASNSAETAAVNKAAALYYNPSAAILYSPHVSTDTKYLSRQTQTNGIPDITVKPQISTTRANRLAFLPADQIIIEKTTDGGTTWVDAQVPDYAKAALFSEVRYSVALPLLNGVKNINCGLRITITGMKYNVPSGTPETEKYNYWNSTYVKSSERYCQLDELYFFVSSNSDGISLKVERAKGASPTTWESSYDSGSTFALTGWSGCDYVKILAGQTFGGGTGQTGNYWNYRLTFFTRNSTGGTTLATTYTTSAQTLLEIRGYGPNVWTYSNNYMKDDHLYTWDYNKNVTFPGAITATSGFSGSGENLTSLSASNISSGTLSTARLPDAYGDTKNPYAAKVANTVLAGPASGNDAAPTFRQLVAADIPLLTKSKISDFPASMPASDVYTWAKAATKPSYSLSEINGTDDLQEIEALTGTSGILKKTAANVWTLDTTTYLASSAISDWAKASTKPSYSLSEIDGTQDLRKIEALSDSSTGFLKKTAANTWALDSTTYLASGDIAAWAKASTKPSYSLNELTDATDIKAIEEVSGTGLLRRVGSNQWELDSTTYSTLTLGTTSSTAYRGDYGNTAYTHASETKSAAVISGLYKFAVTAQGHIASTTAIAKADITALGIPAQDTTYTFDGTYDASTNKAATVKTVTDAIGALDGSVTGTAAASKTLTSFSQTDGKVTATFSDISITKSQISDFPTSMPASDVSAWAKASTKPSYTLSEIDDTQDLRKIEALSDSGTGFLKKTAANTWSLDTTSYLPKTGGNVTGDITLLKQVSSGAPGDSYSIIFQRGVLTDNYNDWKITDSGGYLHFYERGSGSSSWNDRVVFNTTGNVSAASFSGSGASLTSLNASNLSSGTVPIARLPDLSSTYIPVSQKGAASGVATLDSDSKVPIVQSNYLYGKCTTAGGTAAKTVSIDGYDETTIADMEGVTVFVGFNNLNTAANPTLNVSESGAHAIVWGSLSDPMNVGRFSSGLHSFTLVKVGSTYYWYINEGRDTVPEAPSSNGTYILNVSSNGATWHSATLPSAPTTGTVTLNASSWSGNGPYSHAVTISGTTANSKIDLQPNSTVLAQMTTDGTTSIYIENNNGTLTAWAMGAEPTATLAIQYTKTEVA